MAIKPGIIQFATPIIITLIVYAYYIFTLYVHSYITFYIYIIHTQLALQCICSMQYTDMKYISHMRYEMHVENAKWNENTICNILHIYMYI